MNDQQAEFLFATLSAANPHPQSELHYSSVFELLAAVLLSAQATDAGVNKATRSLFARAPTPRAMLALGIDALSAQIRTIGLYRNKAKHLMATCRILVEQHGGSVPRDRDALQALPGVGRKSRWTPMSFALPTAPAWPLAPRPMPSSTNCSRSCRRATASKRTTGSSCTDAMSAPRAAPSARPAR
jgi:endonuclease III